MKTAAPRIVAVVSSGTDMATLQEIVSQLSASFPAPIACLQHISADRPTRLSEVLGHQSSLAVEWATQDTALRGGHVYLCPPRSLMTVSGEGRIALSPRTGSAEWGADSFLASVARAFGPGAVAVALGGLGSRGRDGLRALHAAGGNVIAQSDPNLFGVSHAGATFDAVDAMVPGAGIAPLLTSLARGDSKLAELAAIADGLYAGAPGPGNGVASGLLRTLARFIAMSGADMGNVQLLDRASGELRIVAQRGFGLEFLRHFRAVVPGDGSACGRSMAGAAPVHVRSVREDRHFAPHREIASKAGFAAVQSVPFMDRGGGIGGVISTHYRRPRDFSTADVELARGAARQLQMMLEMRGISA